MKLLQSCTFTIDIVAAWRRTPSLSDMRHCRRLTRKSRYNR